MYYTIVRKFLPVILFLLFASPVTADYQTAKNDYTYQYGLYQKAIDNYQIAKSTYQTYRTLTSQNQAIVALRAAIATRDRVMSSYYDLLFEKLGNDTFAKIRDSQKAWFTDHQKEIDAAASLEDLNAAAARFEDRSPKFDREAKQAIGTILLTKEAVLKQETDQNIQDLNSKLSQMRQSGQDTSLFDRGLITIKNKLDLYDQKTAAARDVFFAKESSEPINLYAGTKPLTEANQYLREAVIYLLEIIKNALG